MSPCHFPGVNVEFAKSQSQYSILPAHRDTDGKATFCWRLTFRERIAVLFRGCVWHQVLTFGQPLQPQKLTVEKPI